MTFLASHAEKRIEVFCYFLFSGAKGGIKYENKVGKIIWTQIIHNEEEWKRGARKQKLVETEELVST